MDPLDVEWSVGVGLDVLVDFPVVAEAALVESLVLGAMLVWIVCLCWREEMRGRDGPTGRAKNLYTQILCLGI